MYNKRVTWENKPPFEGIYISNICIINYWNWTTTVKIIVRGLTVSVYNAYKKYHEFCEPMWSMQDIVLSYDYELKCNDIHYSWVY